MPLARPSLARADDERLDRRRGNPVPDARAGRGTGLESRRLNRAVPMKPLPWQARFLRGVRGVRTAALTVPRSNGKTYLAARMARDYLLGPERDSECVIVASSYGQAKVLYRYAVQMVRAEGHNPDDRKEWQFQDSSNRGLLRSRRTGQSIRALGCDPQRAHGRRFGLALLDEPAQWPNTRDEMLAAIQTGAGKIEASRIVALGTRPADPDHWFSRWLSGGAGYVQSHAAKRSDPPYWLKTIRKANPSYDHLPALRADVLAQRERAKVSAADRASYLSLALNLGTPDTLEALLIDPDDWTDCEVGALPPATGGYALGVDLGSGAAMTAAAGYWPETGRLEALGCFGGIPDLTERGRADMVGERYATMYRAGDLVLQEGRRVPHVGRFLSRCLDRWGVPAVIVADRWREGELRDGLEAARCPMVPLIVRGQGFKDGGQDVRAFRRAALSGKVSVLKSLLVRAAIHEARVAMDPAGNAKLAKGGQGKRRLRARDDVAAAAILAIAEGSRAYRPQDTPSPVPVKRPERPAPVSGPVVRTFGPGATA